MKNIFRLDRIAVTLILVFTGVFVFFFYFQSNAFIDVFFCQAIGSVVQPMESPRSEWSRFNFPVVQNNSIQ